ncbi:hypothetical protein [Stigmatella aurantiaca]|nr:hypothetical protein [Stigmatella aurantiaca]ADO72244.1 uncharacterized protein STAUR_4464 [Stigmatella aurantiaca DW4/3-1]
MTSPLTFYTAVKQDAESQQKMQQIQAAIPTMRDALINSKIVHFARFVAVPNPGGQGVQAMMVITEFDESMDSYVEFFFNDPSINKAFTLIAEVSVNPPALPLNLNDFINWVARNNLSKTDDSMFSAYTQSVAQILNKFSAGA